MVTDGLYYFNRCRRCGTLGTKLQVLRAFQMKGELCSCGSSMFGPTNPLRHEWFTPRVLKMIVYKLLGRLAPPPTEDLVPPTPAGSMMPVPPLSKDEIRAPEEGE